MFRTRGTTRGPITRLMSPGDLGQLVKPFVFLDLFTVKPGPSGLSLRRALHTRAQCFRFRFRLRLVCLSARCSTEKHYSTDKRTAHAQTGSRATGSAHHSACISPADTHTCACSVASPTAWQCHATPHNQRLHHETAPSRFQHPRWLLGQPSAVGGHGCQVAVRPQRCRSDLPRSGRRAAGASVRRASGGPAESHRRPEP
ncbi:hypothetical protein XHV734_0045 [Xanthomonas hortorum pv. vitians]|nr:hypothetical protein XHV734_0045 [Xanthomonas hortorum pv. vitians]